MKIKTAALTATIILGSLGTSYLLYDPPKEVEKVENTAIAEKETYIITSEEESVFFDNAKTFKEKQLLTLKNRYIDKLDSINFSKSNIDIDDYSEVEATELKAKYTEVTGQEGSLKQALLWEAEQDYEQKVEEIEKYTDKTLDKATLKNEEPINVPDKALKQALQQEIGSEGDIYFKDVARITDLDLKGADITSLKGLEYAVNLETLNLEGITIDPLLEFRPLGFLQNLEILNMLNIFNHLDVLPLEYVTGNVEYVALEENLYPAKSYNFELVPYLISEEQTENLETTPDDFFIFDPETKTIKGFKGEVDQTLNIPAEIEGIKVEEIAQEAFKNKGIKTLTLPDNNIFLGPNAFLENEITEIEVSEKIENITGAFDHEVNVTLTGGN